MNISKKTKTLLCVALVLILLGSALAGLFNTGVGATKVTRISFDGGHGRLSGLLYMPKDASADNPKPTVIVTHGYLNSAEMQDANAIELSRRGFVVLALTSMTTAIPRSTTASIPTPASSASGCRSGPTP